MAERLAHRLLLVGWDAADWQIIRPMLDAGLMPSLAMVVGQGVTGNLATLEPILSPMLWTSIATGKRADQHGILGFVEPEPARQKLRPVSSTSRRGKAIWNILTQHGIHASVIGWFASHPAEPISGVAVSNLYPLANSGPGEPWPLPAGAIHPPRVAEDLAALRIHPSELTDAHLLPFVPNAGKIDQEKDRRLAVLAKLLAENSSIHAAATWVMENEPWEFLAVYYDLIDHMGHAFMPFHPPRMQGIPEADFELYKDVVTGAYRYSDMMLGRLLQLAGPDTTVVILSDHGFYSDHLRPRGGRPGPKNQQPIAWHRPFGIVGMRGPHIRQDVLIFGAGLLDITPTLLTLLGLPIGEDMEGRPLLQIFDRPVTPDRIPSWESVPGPCGMHSPERREDPWEAQAAVKQLMDLGYLDAPPDDSQKALELVEADRQWNLARVHMHAGRHGEAVALLRDLHDKRPDEAAFALSLAQCCHALGDLAECRHLVEAVLSKEENRPSADLLMGNLCFAENRVEEALTHLLRAEQANPRLPTLHCQIGSVYVRQGRWQDAQRAFQRALEIDGDSAAAHHGLAMVHLKARRFEAAADEALAAVGLQHHLPLAHYHLGVALAHLGQPLRAIQALETCLAMRARTPAAHRWLAELHERATGDLAQAARHHRLAEELAAPSSDELVIQSLLSPPRLAHPPS